MEQTFRADPTPVNDRNKNITILSNGVTPLVPIPHQEGDSTTNSSSSKKPAKRTPACAQCRRRKIGCDRLRPFCSNCVKYHKERCIYPEEDLEAFNAYINQPAVHKNHNDTNHSDKSNDKSNNNNNNYNGNRTTFEVNSIVPGTNTIPLNNSVPPNFNDMSTTFSIQRMPMQAPGMAPSSSSSQFPVNTTMIQSDPNTQTGSRATTMSPMQTIPLNPTMQMMNNNNYNNTSNNSSVMKMEQQLKFHNVQNAPVYEPPVLVQLPVVESSKVVKPTKTKNTHHGHHHNMNVNINNLKSVAQPKNVVSMEDIGAYNTKTHMVRLLKAWERKQRTLPILNNDITDFSVMQSTYKQKDILLKEMKHLKYRFIELQKRRKKLFPQSVTKEASLMRIPIIPIPEAIVDTENDPNQKLINGKDDNKANQSIPQSYLGLIAPSEKLSVINLHLNNENRLRGDLLLKDTPNAVFTLNYMVNRDPFLVKYYNRLQTYIILNFKEQLTQYKQKQFNEANKRMGNSTVENNLLLRLINKLIKDMTSNNQQIKLESSGFNKFLLSIMEVESMDIKTFEEQLLSQFNKVYEDSPSNKFKNYFSEVSKFGILLIVLLLYLRDNNIGNDPEIEVLNRKLNHIINEVESVNDKMILLNDLSIVTFLSIKNLYHDMFEDNDRLNDVNNNRDIYLTQIFQSNMMTPDMKYSIYSNYIHRNIFIGNYPSLVTIEMLKSILPECEHVIDYKINEINFWEIEYKLLEIIQNRGSTNMASIQELMKYYTQFKHCEGKLMDYRGIPTINNGIHTILDYSNNNNIMKQSYYKSNLLINYYLLLQYESMKLHDKFNKVLQELINFIDLIISEQYNFKPLDNFSGSKTILNKRNLVILEIVCEILFSIGLRFASKVQNNNPVNNLQDNELNDVSVAMSVVKDKIRKILIKIIISIQRNTMNLSGGHRNIAKRLELKLLNFMKAYKEDTDNNLKLNNGIVLLTSSEINIFSEKVSSISQTIIQEDEDYTFHSEYKKIIENVQTDIETNNNDYGLTKDTFSSIFEAMFQK
ncbi:similar to Saccharomyces cerevisiae YHR056C RSC30 Component of the RSC chromatin remodeling complex [Maudiozyma saulgeensis]|uniref:Similar to Saccharomyces cerevisiae YHR056C RSC30 Component of the RSC chromatin remodeling complex n=1 Tax=Maudiozyma saulgeensis TaxID=1789683 RepID=A0A1X7QYE5_9SACH|nr:similar to Saccharomyces cerevisiae YHR056C RSC30 Component of the RSC chromatin remodeling complex [Kazachstania saulgeensis]